MAEQHAEAALRRIARAVLAVTWISTRPAWFSSFAYRGSCRVS